MYKLLANFKNSIFLCRLSFDSSFLFLNYANLKNEAVPKLNTLLKENVILTGINKLFKKSYECSPA